MIEAESFICVTGIRIFTFYFILAKPNATKQLYESDPAPVRDRHNHRAKFTCRVHLHIMLHITCAVREMPRLPASSHDHSEAKDTTNPSLCALNPTEYGLADSLSSVLFHETMAFTCTVYRKPYPHSA